MSTSLGRHVLTSILFCSVVALLGGCGLVSAPESTPVEATSPTTPTTPTTPAATPTPELVAFPDPCTLLSEAEVRELTGRDITQVDHDGRTESDRVRWCQWQQSSGNLVIGLRDEDFAFMKTQGTDVFEVGDGAVWVIDKLFVLVGPVMFSVQPYWGADEAEKQEQALKVAQVLLPRVRALT